MNGAITWFARNHVAANLLMFLIVAGGLLTLPRIKKEVFPEIDADVITVQVPYPGAAPAEVEEGICVRIEERLYGLDGVESLDSTAAEGMGVVIAEIETGADPQRVLDDIKARVDEIDTFPEESENPIIQQVVLRQQVINVAVSGDVDRYTLKRIGQTVRDEITALPEITVAELRNAPPYEISIEVPEATLRRYGLTFDEVVAAVRRGSVDLPGGSIKTGAGEVLLRTKGQAYRGADFERIILLSRPDGTRLAIGDVATVVDGFEETDQSARFDGQPTVLVQVFRVGDQNALDVSEAVHRYVREAQAHMPAGITLTTWDDDARFLRGRLRTLLENGRDGFFLVLMVLALFLRLRLAMWVIVGLPVSFLGGLWLMPVFDLSINVISLFAFIVVLGILVDDAIVVGENVYTKQTTETDPLSAAIHGARQVGIPVTFGVLTTIAAFAPMLTVPGTMGKLMRTIPLIVISCLAFSLIESLFVLPAHLARHGATPEGGETARTRIGRLGQRLQSRINDGLQWFIEHVYRPSLTWVMEWRYLVAAGMLALLIGTASLITGGWIRFHFFPEVEGDRVVADLTLPLGTPVDVTEAGVHRLLAAIDDVRRNLAEEGHGGAVRHLLAAVGEHPTRQQSGPPGSSLRSASGSHLGEVTLELSPSEDRDITATEIAHRWRERTGAIPDAVELVFRSAIVHGGEPISVQLKGPSIDHLRAAAERLKDKLATYTGVFDVTDSFRGGKQELELDIRPAGQALGLSLADLGRQVRQAFYGEEAQRIQRGRDDVRVMVRYPEAERRSLANIEDMRIRTPDGTGIPFRTVAEIEYGRGFAAIQRVDRERVITVTADIDPAVTNANEIAADLRQTILPELVRDYRGLSWDFEGEQERQSEVLGGLGRGFLLALIAIFALLAIPLRSYVQPVIIMTAIPFGLIGAVFGHLVLGYNLSMFSLIGLVALAGVVVNDSLVMVTYVNLARDRGLPLERAIRDAGAARFRPILLTSLTTFAGLTPLMMERSVQAQFLIPMAISLAFGVLFATVISLVMVPATYAIIEDLQNIRPTPAKHPSPAHS